MTITAFAYHVRVSQCPGPKLKRFKSSGDLLDIDFIQYLGKGVHGQVWKVQIDGAIYALKIVCTIPLRMKQGYEPKLTTP